MEARPVPSARTRWPHISRRGLLKGALVTTVAGLATPYVFGEIDYAASYGEITPPSFGILPSPHESSQVIEPSQDDLVVTLIGGHFGRDVSEEMAGKLALTPLADYTHLAYLSYGKELINPDRYSKLITKGLGLEEYPERHIRLNVYAPSMGGKVVTDTIARVTGNERFPNVRIGAYILDAGPFDANDVLRPFDRLLVMDAGYIEDLRAKLGTYGLAAFQMIGDSHNDSLDLTGRWQNSHATAEQLNYDQLISMAETIKSTAITPAMIQRINPEKAVFMSDKSQLGDSYVILDSAFQKWNHVFSEAGAAALHWQRYKDLGHANVLAEPELYGEILASIIRELPHLREHGSYGMSSLR